eukprot:CAMPEP_0118934364 /NCGR_PEP_ID=MMETSP1169-20130426/13783_1 /TAXON_ID=36882 /ORGANISM="Pyramimonas obovata, Strain CCMP722" /LENGTH=140 /DNA_ID=CAMNT_0006877263 /DNA_START=73 /DNA_END=495 /DNA_ORIENTATION=+
MQTVASTSIGLRPCRLPSSARRSVSVSASKPSQRTQMASKHAGSFSKGTIVTKRSLKALHVASAGLPNIPNPFESPEEKPSKPVDPAKYEEKDFWENDAFEYIFKVSFVGLAVGATVLFLNFAVPVLKIMGTAFPLNPGV